MDDINISKIIQESLESLIGTTIVYVTSYYVVVWDNHYTLDKYFINEDLRYSGSFNDELIDSLESAKERAEQWLEES